MTVGQIKTQNYQWHKAIGGKEPDGGRVIDTDSKGNVVVCGVFEDTVDFAPGSGIAPLTSPGGFQGNGAGHIFVSKFDSLGNLIWVKKIGGPSYHIDVYGVSSDQANNIYVTGYFSGAIDLDPGAGSSYYNNNGSGYCGFIVKLDPTGNYKWGGITGNPGISVINHCLETDVNGNIIYGGLFSSYNTGNLDLDPGGSVYSVQTPANTAYFGYLTKLDSMGNFIWARTFENFQSGISEIATDFFGNIYSTGQFTFPSQDFDPGPGTYTLTGHGQEDAFISKLNSNGNFIWAKVIGGPKTDYGWDVVVDRVGNSHLIGQFRDSIDLDPGPLVSSRISSGNTDSFVLKLDSAGNFIWGETYGGPNQDSPMTVDLDNRNNVLIAGFDLGLTDFNPGPSVFNLPNPIAYYNSYILKLDSLGGFLWAKSMQGLNSPGNNAPMDLSTDKSNNIYLTGDFGGTVDFDPDAGIEYSTTNGGGDIFILKLGACIGKLKTDSLNTICEGESTTLHASGAYSYSWMPDGQTTDSIIVNPISNMTYTVTGSKSSDCMGTALISVVVDPCVGMKDLTIENNSIDIFPNPSSGNFTVKAGESMSLRIVNELGQTIQRIELDEKNNFLEQFQIQESGVFFLKSRSIYKKIVVLR
ncbi:MAG: SBBP repeat-containing protein [Bacteroidia bacterium]|nr:SBBP repeat-containing protein [Bacteroidia bacterium]